MIARLVGEIISIEENAIIVQTGGIGLRVYVPSSLIDNAVMGKEVILFTHLVIRQDLLALYGFATEEEEQFFRLLLGVDGVGPRLALAVLSTLSVDAVRRAVLSDQPEVFSRVPGVGKKTAQKIGLYLQGKVGEISPLQMVRSDTDTQVLEALTSLGYSVVEAQAAIQSIPRNTPDDLETRLRIALQYFSNR